MNTVVMTLVAGAAIIIIYIGWIHLKGLIDQVRHPSLPEYMILLASALDGKAYNASRLKFLYNDSIKGYGLKKVKDTTVKMVMQFTILKGEDDKEFKDRATNILKSLMEH